MSDNDLEPIAAHHRAWLRCALAVILGEGHSEWHLDHFLGARGTLIVSHAGRTAEVPIEVAREHDAAALMDCFFCAACGHDLALGEQRPFLWSTPTRVRRVCVACVIARNDIEGAIRARDAACGVAGPEWAREAHGMRVGGIDATAELERMERVAGIDTQPPPASAPRNVTLCPLCQARVSTFELESGNEVVVRDGAVVGVLQGRRRFSAKCEGGCEITVLGPPPKQERPPA